MSDDREPTPVPASTAPAPAAPASLAAPPRGRATRALSNVYLARELAAVTARYRRLILLAGSAVATSMLAAAGVAALFLVRGADPATPVLALIFLGVVATILGPVLARALRRVQSPAWVARRIEMRFPALDARLLAAVEQQALPGGKAFGFLEQTLVDETLAHARAHTWAGVVPARHVRSAAWANAGALAAVLAIAAMVVVDLSARRGTADSPAAGPAVAAAAGGYELTVEPGDASVERGTSLIVLARFGGPRVPSDVTLLIRGDDKQRPESPMSKSMDDPVFAARVPSVDGKLAYAVRYGSQQSRWYAVDVYDHPDLKQVDARLAFPAYTGMPEKTVEDTRSVTAVEGTKATLTFRLTKPVKSATLVPETARGTTNPADVGPPAIPLTPDPKEPDVYTAVVDMKQSVRYRLTLADEAGRDSKRPAELALNVTANRPPELKLDFPAKDVDVSPIEELTVRAKVWDDFGVKRVGLSYSMAGRPPQDVVLAQDVAGKDRRDVSHTVALEQLAAEPDQLLSYYFWAEDVAADGSTRRTSGDMFFAEVRPFEEMFRQGEPPAGGEPPKGKQAGQNAQAAEEAAEGQKQIVAATWKLVRRETSAAPTPAFAADARLLAESQAAVREKAAAMEEKLTDERSKTFLRNVLKHMEAAVAELTKAAEVPATDRAGVDRLPAALAAEQAAYQELLRLRAREHEVVRSSRQQGGQQSQSSASSRKQRQLDQLKLTEEQNRYEQQRSAAQQQQAAQDPQQRETRQVLSRLRELAQRQEDLNKQMKESQSALAEAKDEAKKEEARKQLARLRDQQKEMLRDTDELRDRAEQPANQDGMAEARQKLDQTREDVRKAAEALEQGKTAEASAAGARAGERLNNLKEEFRRKAAGQFGEAAEQMRLDARELDDKQQALSQKLARMDGADKPADGQAKDGAAPKHPGLREAAKPEGGREQVARDLDQQKERLEQLLEKMRKTVEEAEPTEPLLSKQLYDAVRDARQVRTDEALDAAKQMVDRGVVDEARRAEGEAGKGIARLRQGVEQAAKGVLGDETEALRRARGELDALGQQLEREMARNGVAPTPNAADGNDAARGEPSTRPAGGRRQVARGGPQSRPAGDVGHPQASSRPGGRKPDGQEASGKRPGGQQPDQVKPGESGQPRAAGGEPGQGESQAPGRGQTAGDGQPGEGQGKSPGQGQAQADGQGQRPGQGLQGRGEGQGQGQGQGMAEGGDQPGQARGSPGRPPGGLRAGGGSGNPDAGRGEEVGGTDGRRDDDGGEQAGPMTGDNFRQWSDRLRDVEEMVGDPKLRAEAARIRERAKAARADAERHSKGPNWDVVRSTIGRPLAELRAAVAEELRRRDPEAALVPVDRDPVPPGYAEQVRKYYERLGSGK